MVIQGFGIVLAFTPTMTAAFRALRRNEINDASSQLNIVMRVGGSIGTAILTIILENYLNHAGGSLSAQAAAFSIAFRWVLAISAVAVVPIVVLVLVERRHAKMASGEDGGTLAPAPHLVEVE